MAANQSSSPTSSSPSTDLETIQGQLTLAQFVNEIEAGTGSPVVAMHSGSCGIVVYHRNTQLVDPNLMVDVAVAQLEARSVVQAQERTVANKAIGRHRVKPKRAERINNAIYFIALCEDNKHYSVSWRP